MDTKYRYDIQMNHIISIIVVAFFILGPFSAVHGEDTENIDDILSGFESESTATEDEDADVLDGFEEYSAPEDGSNGDSEILEGFDDEAALSEKDNAAPLDTSMVSLDGYFKVSPTYNFAHNAPAHGETDWRGLSKLRTELQVELEFDLAANWEAFVSGQGFYDFAYVIKGRDEFTQEVLDENESELECKDTYIQGSLTRNLDIKLGRQIVVWGKSDHIRVTDVLNPLDLREPGLTDIENLRLPVIMTRLDYYFKDFSLTGIGVHEIRFNKTPAFGSDFYPLSTPPPPEDKPQSSLENTEYALALNGIFSGWDMALYWADVYNDAAHLESVSDSSVPLTKLTHNRIQMIGASLNLALGNWLLKTEAAYFNGLKYFATGDEQFSRTDLLVGIEYSGFDETTIMVEAVNRHIHDFDNALEKSPDNEKADDFQWVVRYTRDFWNDTLTLTLLANNFGIHAENGAFQRLTLEYDITDAVSMLGGVVFYQSGDKLQDVDNNDRLIFDVTFHF